MFFSIIQYLCMQTWWKMCFGIQIDYIKNISMTLILYQNKNAIKDVKNQVDWIRMSLKMCLERTVPMISKILCLKPMKTLWTFSCIVHIHEKYYWNTVRRSAEAIMIWKPFWKPLNFSFDWVCARNLKFLVTTIFSCFFSLWSDRSNVLNPPVSTFSIKDQL